MKGYAYKYQIALWWSDADEAFIAMAPEVPGAIMDGPTAEAALSNLNEVIEICLDIAREENGALPQPAGRLLPVQNEFDWKRSKPQVENDSSLSRRAPSPRAQFKPKLTPVAQSKKRSTHVTT
jgi:predicted RNase H-like HicB family nuclease